MKVELDLPDWVDERHIYIVSGIEMVAYSLYGERKWYVKTDRCNMCGKCCTTSPKEYLPFPRNEKGDCIHLRKSKKGDYGECILGVNRPWVCCTDLTQKKKKRFKKCTVDYKAVK